MKLKETRKLFLLKEGYIGYDWEDHGDNIIGSFVDFDTMKEYILGMYRFQEDSDIQKLVVDNKENIPVRESIVSTKDSEDYTFMVSWEQIPMIEKV